MTKTNKDPLIKISKRQNLALGYKLLLTIGAILLSLVLGGILLACLGYNPVDFYVQMILGNFKNSSYLKLMVRVLIPLLITSLGVSFLAFIGGLQTIPKDQYEAAAVDGIRNRWQELWYVTLPNMKQQLLFGAVMSITQYATKNSNQRNAYDADAELRCTVYRIIYVKDGFLRCAGAGRTCV